MQQKLSSTLYLFTPDRLETDSLQNAKNRAAVSEVLSKAGVRFAVTEGTYKGQHEHGFCAFLPSNPGSVEFEKADKLIQGLCAHYRQEFLLEVSAERTGRLIRIDTGELVPLGHARFSDEQPVTGDYTKFVPGQYLQVS